MARRILTLLVSVALVVTGLTAVSVASTSTSASASAGPISMLGKVNAARAKKGLKPLKWNKHLAAVAAGQARRMAANDRLYHNPKLAGRVGNFRRVGENVAYGRTKSGVHKGLMRSQLHRANILGNYKQVGIAQVRDKSGRLWVVQVFRTPH